MCKIALVVKLLEKTGGLQTVEAMMMVETEPVMMMVTADTLGVCHVCTRL